MQQSVSEEAAPYEPSVSYDDLFPALPESNNQNQNHNTMGPWNNKMRVGSSIITQVFRVPFEERKLDHSQKFGEGESVQTCGNIMKETGAHLEISYGKDQSLTFLITGKQSEVLEARRRIVTNFQTQASKQISIPKEHHRWILGKKGERLKDLEKQTATKISVPSVNDQSDLIVITGTKEGIEKAEHEIKITSDQQSKKASERISVPKIYHPFILGPYNEYLSNLMAETGAKVNVPPPSVMKDEIFIVGEKEGVLAAKNKIDAIYKQMEKKCTTVSVEVPKQQHKYVIGPKGSTIAEILGTTGVSVEMPQGDSATGTITLRGPHDKLGVALSKVYEKANSVRSSYVESPAWLHKFIIGRKGASIKEITQNLPKVHVEFTEKDNKIKIEGPPEEVEKAEELLDRKTKELIQTMTFVELQVDPKLFKHIIGKSGANVNRLKDEFDVTINIDESGLIRIEGSVEGVQRTKTELEERIFKLENEKEKDVIIEQRHYRTIIGTKGEKIREIRDKFNNVQIIFPNPSDNSEIVKVRGPKEDVDKCCQYLYRLVREMAEASFQKEVPIFKQFHKFIIGKGGVNIRKIREETHTKIDLPSESDKNNVIKITGKRENVDEAYEKIRKIQDELENIVADKVTISPKFYNSLIGAKGKLINSIMEECGGVTIKFPTADSKSDVVTIRGPQEDVDRAKQQLLSLASERQLASYTAEIRAKPQQHKFLIGKSGTKIKKIRDSTGARIVFPSKDDDDLELITIIGKKEAVEEAKAILEAEIKEIDNTVELEILVPPKHHKHFVARRGEVLHRIGDECGGVIISFPRSGVDSDRVTLKGAKECIDAAVTRINEEIVKLESMVTIECIIQQVHHRNVMGAKGHKVQAISYDCDVQIKFPDRDNRDDYSQMNGDVVDGEGERVRQCDVIRITGKEANCLKAKQALLDLVPITLKVDVPFDLHRSIIGHKGKDVRELMDNFDVRIVLSPADVREDVIEISGTPANVERAREALLERVKERELRSFNLKLEVNPDYHPKIIGKKGSVITKIRKDHDVQINFPRKGDPDEHIIKIMGYEENTYRARDAIMKIVNELNEQCKEEIDIDPRVHSRIIGARGRNIKKIMEDYSVDIKFPRNDDPNPNLVIISGVEDNVVEAREHLLNIAEEYVQDVEETEQRDKHYSLSSHINSSLSNFSTGNSHNNAASNGFVVQGGPWEQRKAAAAVAPNTASVTEFPSFGRNTEEPPATSPVSGAWGSRR